MRATIGSWLRRARVDAEIRDDVLLAAHEAAATAIEHMPRPVLEVTADGQSVTIVVTMPGEQSSPEPDEGGYRMRLLRALVSHVGFEAGPSRSLLRLEKRV